MHASVPGPVTLKGSNLQVPLKGLLLSGFPMGRFFFFFFCPSVYLVAQGVCDRA